MRWKKIGKKLLFPPAAVPWVLLPLCAAGLVRFLREPKEPDAVRIAVYALSFYALVVWCARMPKIVRRIKAFREENPVARRWFSDVRWRTNVTLCASALWNGAYAALQLGLGIFHGSAWFYALTAYYASLAAMRFFLARHTLRHKLGDRMRRELARYRACGWVFLVMNTALSVMMFHMIRQNRAVRHHEITTIAMATYTFTALTVALVNVFRYRKYNSPALSAAKAISLAAAGVSLLTLENTMLTTFGGAEMPPRTRRLFLAPCGAAVSICLIAAAIRIIVRANQKMKLLGDTCNGK